MSVIWFVRYAPKEIGRQRPESSIPWISFDIAYCTTHWEEIYPVHRVIHPAFKIERGLEPRRECSCVFALLTLHVFLLQISNLLFLFYNTLLCLNSQIIYPILTNPIQHRATKRLFQPPQQLNLVRPVAANPWSSAIPDKEPRNIPNAIIPNEASSLKN